MDATIPDPLAGSRAPDRQPDALDRLLQVLDLRHLEGWGPRGEEDVLRGNSMPGPGQPRLRRPGARAGHPGSGPHGARTAA